MMRHHSAATAVLKVVCLLCVLLSAGCMRTAQDSKVTVPKDRPGNTIAVFAFRWKGDADAKFYAPAFSRSLSDRLYGTAGCQINQPNINAIQEQLDWLKQKMNDPIPDGKAITAAKTLGAHYALTGDFELHGDDAVVSLRFTDLTAGSPKPSVIRCAGKLADLPKMQTMLAADVIKAMRMDPHRALAGTNAVPNFFKPSVLLLYGRSLHSNKVDKALSLRWRCVDEDPDSLFAVLRVLGTYVYGESKCRTVRADKRLQAFVPAVGKRFSDNCQIGYLTGRLYVQQYQYKKAEEHMRAVVKRFPDYASGHGALAVIAGERYEPDVALSEARKVVSLWPTNPIAHSNLAWAYGLKADTTHWARSVSLKSIGAVWKKRRYSQEAYREASVALELDPRNMHAWQIVMHRSRELGYSDYDRRAFEQMVKLDPKNYDAYSAYSRILGYRDSRDEFCARVDKAFGKDSAEACLLRGWLLRSWADSDIEREEVVRLADKALAKSKGDILPALILKTEGYISLHKRAEMLELARKGYALDPSPTWASFLAKGYEFRWEDKHDPRALHAAYKLWTHYVDEFPNAAYGHDHLGWCLSHMGRRASAKKEFERALQIDPGDQFAKEKMAYVQ